MASPSFNGDKYRSYLHGEEEKNTKWRFGAPPNYHVVNKLFEEGRTKICLFDYLNYHVVNKLFEEGRTKIWPPGSLEENVQNLVKNWEMEFFHKACIEDFKTIDPNKYTFSLNGRKALTIEEIGKLGGGYNPLLQTSMPEQFRCYNPADETAESSHKAFTTTFPQGFALEILRVYSGPPVIVYKFRHWGYMEGPFNWHAPTGELVEFFGMAIFEVDEAMKIVKVEFFYDRGELLGGLLKGTKIDGSASAKEACSNCPVLRNTG